MLSETSGDAGCHRATRQGPDNESVSLDTVSFSYFSFGCDSRELVKFVAHPLLSTRTG